MPIVTYIQLCALTAEKWRKAMPLSVMPCACVLMIEDNDIKRKLYVPLLAQVAI